MYLLNVCVIYFSIICDVQSVRILGIFHMPTYSHFQIGDRIFKELASRGHEVTVISPFELKAPVKNLQHIVLSGFNEDVDELRAQLYDQPDLSVLDKIMEGDRLGYMFTEYVLNHSNVQKLLKSDATFDLVIRDFFFNEAFAGFAHTYNAPDIEISTMGPSSWSDTKMGNPHNPSYVPSFFVYYDNDMNLVQRTFNTLVYIATELYDHLQRLPNQNKLLQKHFPNAPQLSELHYNTSLLLLNSHVSTHSPIPLVPNMIEIGGSHIQPPKTLPKDLQDYLDQAKDGFIFVSMGSNLKSKDMPVQTRKDILNVFRKLKQNVLWKWEDDVLPDQPPNVKLGKWLPQQDILGHTNIKLFITHGGLLSTIEAVYNGVPVLGLPVYGDQELNILTAEYAGYGIGIPFKQINETSLMVAILELLNNPKYTENAKTRSKIMHDQPQTPLDRAIYWIEYVLRHHDASHLRTAALDLHWYQGLLLDVAAFIFLSTTVTLYILYRAIKFLCGVKIFKNINKDKKKN